MLEADPRAWRRSTIRGWSRIRSTPCKQLFRSFGSLMSFELKDSIDCFDYLNRLNLAVAASNLGDTRTLVIPVAHTIFYEMGAERRASMGIADR
jgi:O-acetylhomoserine (thiol)-lyase